MLVSRSERCPEVRLQILLLELESYQGTVITVTHDRWFARSFERFLIFTPDGNVRAATEPSWD